MKFWKGYYCRWNPRMRPQDSVHLRHAQILTLRDQLQVPSLSHKFTYAIFHVCNYMIFFEKYYISSH